MNDGNDVVVHARVTRYAHGVLFEAGDWHAFVPYTEDERGDHRARRRAAREQQRRAKIIGAKGKA